MGTFVCSGHGKVYKSRGSSSIYIIFIIQGIVTGTGENSEFGNVFKMMQSEEVNIYILY